VVQIADNGVGGADPGSGSGLRDRIDALDGSIRVASEPGGGTTVAVRIPLGSADDPGR
jgi:signal transduction histidine kinase